MSARPEAEASASAEPPVATSQQLLAAIVSSSDDAIVSKNLNGIVTSWNAGAERIFGYPASEMIGESVLKLIPPELRDEETMILTKIRAGERIEHYETVRVRRNGERINVALTVSPVKDDDGRVIGASKIARDISDRASTERAQSMLAAIVQSSDDAIISKDLFGVVTSWNEAAERLYGFSAEEMVGKSILKVVPPELSHEEDQILAKVRAGERLEHYDTTRLTKDGRLLHVQITVSPIRDTLGRVIGASKIARDMTAQREAQKQKDLFLAVLAHELRNPLAPIRNAIALMRRESLGADQREKALVMAERQTSHMARLLDDLLDVSRLATGKVELKLERIDLRSCAEQAVESVRATLAARNHTLTQEISGEPLYLRADPVRILQILINLLSNAIKYTDPHGRIGFSVTREGDYAVARVTDNGIGFPPETGARLFTLFAQAEGASTRSAGGLGIGLALVREFVERHHGTVEAHSKGPGQGSQFTVRFPLDKGA